MSNDHDERAPLLQFPGSYQQGEESDTYLPDAYNQFCQLIGIKPVDYPPKQNFHSPEDSLYYRAVQHRRQQSHMYAFTAALTNTLILSQVVLGASLTGLGASNSNHIVITVFGALNTVIAGLVAFLKSRGQPMRARMFRDDLDRVVDEIENSATMWKGISTRAHGYDAIDTDDSVTVRSEVARLTRLYDRAVKTSAMNDPDFYGAGVSSDPANAGLRSRTGQTLLPAVPANMPSAGPGPAAQASVTPIPGPSIDPDESPATKAPIKKDEEAKEADAKKPDASTDENGKKPDDSSKPADVAINPDESPATSATPAKPEHEDTEGGAPKS